MSVCVTVAVYFAKLIYEQMLVINAVSGSGQDLLMCDDRFLEDRTDAGRNHLVTVGSVVTAQPVAVRSSPVGNTACHPSSSANVFI